MVLATSCLVLVISLLTGGYVWAIGQWSFDVSGNIKTKAKLDFDPILDYGEEITIPSETLITKEISNIGETDTKNLQISITPLEGLDGISIEWDYSGDPILAGETITIGFTLVVTEEAVAGPFTFTLLITEVAA